MENDFNPRSTRNLLVTNPLPSHFVDPINVSRDSLKPGRCSSLESTILPTKRRDSNLEHPAIFPSHERTTRVPVTDKGKPQVLCPPITDTFQATALLAVLRPLSRIVVDFGSLKFGYGLRHLAVTTCGGLLAHTPCVHPSLWSARRMTELLFAAQRDAR